MQQSARNWTAKNWIVSAVVVVAALSAQSLIANAPTNSDCEDAWTNSSAHNSCGSSYTTGEGEVSPVWAVDTSQYTAIAYNNACQVKVRCMRQSNRQEPTYNVFNGTLGEVESLNNCNGTLLATDC